MKTPDTQRAVALWPFVRPLTRDEHRDLCAAGCYVHMGRAQEIIFYGRHLPSSESVYIGYVLARGHLPAGCSIRDAVTAREAMVARNGDFADGWEEREEKWEDETFGPNTEDDPRRSP